MGVYILYPKKRFVAKSLLVNFKRLSFSKDISFSRGVNFSRGVTFSKGSPVDEYESTSVYIKDLWQWADKGRDPTRKSLQAVT